MKVHFLTRYGERGASSRYRTWQHLPGLEREGIECTATPLLGDEYLDARFARRRPPGLLVRAALRRARERSAWREADLIVVEKELYPYAPAWFERALLGRGTRFTLDFDDALQHIYDQHPRSVVRMLLGRKMQRLVRRARLVTVGNPYLEEAFAPAAGPRTRIESVPTVLDTDRYPVTPEPDAPFTIGWIGTPVSARNLAVVLEPLQRFFDHHRGRLLLIGAGDEPLPGIPVERVSWSAETEADLLASIHVGIMPLFDRPLERGKSGLKLLQYLAAARPVVASPVGVNSSIVTPQVGRLAGDPERWLEALIELHDNPPLRARLGRAGRRLVESSYSLRHWTPRYAAYLREAATTP